MCGRITQHRTRRDYADELGLDVSDHRRWVGGDSIAFYNLPPGLHPQIFYLDAEGRGHNHQLHWGYRPQWAADKGIPMAINARIEKASTGRYFRHMWRSGRVAVPADGWFEWTGESGKKQPWYIRLKTDRPMFMAGISNFQPFTNQEGKQLGFVIVTAAAEAGLVDVHDRRPVVLAPADARLWMDNTMSAEQAEHLARNAALPADVFQWYRVSTAVNNAKNNEKHLIGPLPVD